LIYMKLIVYRFGQRATNPVHFDEIVDAGTGDTLEPSELAQQFSPLLGAESRNLFEWRPTPRPGPPLAVSRDSKPMRLVSHLLDQQ
jgi:hypothetical protein